MLNLKKERKLKRKRQQKYDDMKKILKMKKIKNFVWNMKSVRKHEMWGTNFKLF